MFTSVRIEVGTGRHASIRIVAKLKTIISTLILLLSLTSLPALLPGLKRSCRQIFEKKKKIRPNAKKLGTFSNTRVHC
jgi:hypothetical protein